MKVYTEEEYWSAINLATVFGALVFYIGQLIGGLLV